jgi:chromosome segregation ATPase
MIDLAAVDEKVCEVRHEGVTRVLDSIETQLDKQAEDIGDIKTAIIKLTTLQEIQTQSHEIQTQTLTRHIEALERIETRVATLETTVKQAPAPQPSFWTTSTGTLTIRVTLFLLVVIVLAAIGQDMAPDLAKLLTGK